MLPIAFLPVFRYNVFMYIRANKSPNSPRKAIQIVESVRHGKSVSTRIIQHIGVAYSDEEEQQMRALGAKIIESLEQERAKKASSQTLLFEPSVEEAEEGICRYERPVEEGAYIKISDMVNGATIIEGPMNAAEKLYDLLGLDHIFKSSAREMGKVSLLKQALANTMAHPSSKRGMVQWLREACRSEVSVDRMYRLMDTLCEREETVKRIIKSQTEGLFASKPTLILFDATTLYYESFKEDGLRQCGYSKDAKFKETQIIMALAATTEGLPLWYEIFPGKTWEGDSIKSFVSDWRRNVYEESGGVVVADSGMLTKENMAKLNEEGLNYILGARLKSMKKSEKAEILELSSYTSFTAPVHCFDEADSVLDTENKRILKYKVMKLEGGRNLLVTWDSKRAEKDACDREELLTRLEKKLNGSGKVKGKNLIGNRGTSRFLKVAEGENEASYERDTVKIEQDGKWDGLHGIMTDLPLGMEEEIREALSHYHSLWKIEESFRISKSDLKIRPMYHWTESRIRGHIALCYIAFAMMRQLQKRLLLQQQDQMSVKRIREALLGETSVIIRDKSNGKRLRVPMEQTSEMKKINKVLGIKRTTVPREITSMVQYRNRYNSVQ